MEFTFRRHRRHEFELCLCMIFELKEIAATQYTFTTDLEAGTVTASVLDLFIDKMDEKDLKKLRAIK